MEPIMNQKNREMYFVAKKLDMPLFLLSRNRIKYNRIEPMWNYIANKRLSYTSRCNEENVTETVTTKKQKKLCGFDVSQRTKLCPVPRTLKHSRDLIKTQPWQLSPNRYDVLNVPFKHYGGKWGNLHKHKALPPARGSKQQWKFYELDRETERMQKRCFQYKGTFLTNARDRKATTRCMVSSTLTCYHDPNLPGPTSYYPQNNLIKFAVKTKEKPPNPHIFLRRSCVPAKRNCIHLRNTSFLPGPGRYENRFPKICHCISSGKERIYQPGLQLMIERQKRLKFRRQHFIKLKTKKFCTPDWRHVQGHGHTYLFKHIPPKPFIKPRLKLNKDAKKTERQYKLFPDARYIGMINDPAHQVISMRMEPLIPRKKRIYFNCMPKRLLRRQLRNNKKIAFNSGQERFKDTERPTVLTVSEQEAKKKLLPTERQLRDYPITNQCLSEIKGKLHETPAHMRPTFELELRKRNFKFLPLPNVKVLVTEADLRPNDGENYVMGAFFAKDLNIMDYLRDSMDDKDLQDIKEYGGELKKI